MIIKKNEKLDFFQYTCTSVFRKKEKVKLYKAYSVADIDPSKPLDFDLTNEMMSISPECAAQYILKTLSSEGRTKFAGSEIVVLEFILPMDEIRKFPCWDETVHSGEPEEWFGSFSFQMRERNWTSLKVTKYRVKEGLSFEDKGDTVENVENLALEKIG